MIVPRKLCPVCRAPIRSSFKMLSDRSVTEDGEEEWVTSETENFLVNLGDVEIRECREVEEVNIDICMRCDTAFS